MTYKSKEKKKKMRFGKSKNISQIAKDKVILAHKKIIMMDQSQWFTGSITTPICTKFTNKDLMKWAISCGQNNKTNFYIRPIKTYKNNLMISNL